MCWLLDGQQDQIPSTKNPSHALQSGWGHHTSICMTQVWYGECPHSCTREGVWPSPSRGWKSPDAGGVEGRVMVSRGQPDPLTRERGRVGLENMQAEWCSF